MLYQISNYPTNRSASHFGVFSGLFDYMSSGPGERRSSHAVRNGVGQGALNAGSRGSAVGCVTFMSAYGVSAEFIVISCKKTRFRGFHAYLRAILGNKYHSCGLSSLL